MMTPLTTNTTTIQLRRLLQTDTEIEIDPAMVPRVLGAMSGIWSSRNLPVTDWLNQVGASGTVIMEVNRERE